jgi:hypothetical protein
MVLTAAIFFLAGGLNLLLAKWLDAAFFLAGGFVFLKGREMERWPRAVRYLFIVALAALAAAMFLKLFLDLKAGGTPR